MLTSGDINPAVIISLQSTQEEYILKQKKVLRLTFGADQAAVVADWTQVLEHKNCHRHYGQAHHKHHDPNRRAVGLCRRKRRRNKHEGLK